MVHSINFTIRTGGQHQKESVRGHTDTRRHTDRERCTTGNYLGSTVVCTAHCAGIVARAVTVVASGRSTGNEHLEQWSRGTKAVRSLLVAPSAKPLVAAIPWC